MPRLRDDERFLHNGERFRERKSKRQAFIFNRLRDADQSFVTVTFGFVFAYPCIVLSDFNTTQKIHQMNFHVDEIVCVHETSPVNLVWEISAVTGTEQGVINEKKKKNTVLH